MNRRDLLKWLGIAPVAAALPAVAKALPAPSCPSGNRPVVPIDNRAAAAYLDMRRDANAELMRFTKEINREFVRENLFAPYLDDQAVHDAVMARVKFPK
jgi:hypothetical protein